MELIEHSSEEQMTREEAAQRLRDLADQLARHNEAAFEKEGIRYTVKVPKQVTVKLEIEVEGDGGEIEFELSW